jgi:hypothetical protein
MAQGRVIVRLSSPVAQEAAKFFTESEVQKLVIFVATHVDAGIHSGEIPDLRKLLWKSDTHGNFEIWYLAHDITSRVDVVALIQCSKTRTAASHQDLIKIAFKVAVIGRLFYRMYQLGEKVLNNLLG